MCKMRETEAQKDPTPAGPLSPPVEHCRRGEDKVRV